MGPLPHVFRLQNYISSGEAPREGRFIITTFVPSTASWRVNFFDNQKQVILGPTRLQATQVFRMPIDSHVIDTIREDLKTDAFAQAILVQIDPSRASCSQSQPPGTDYRQFNYHDRLLFFKELLYVPNGSCRLRVVQNCHDTYTAGHCGSIKTLDLVQR